MKTLLQTYRVDTIDFLKIDTEGHDMVILDNYIDALNEGLSSPAKKIEFESNVLVDEREVDRMISRLGSIGYTLETRGHDTVMVFSK